MVKVTEQDKADILTRELFGSELEKIVILPWNDLVTQTLAAIQLLNVIISDSLIIKIPVRLRNWEASIPTYF